MSATALTFIMDWEQCRLKAYLDSGGVCTVGWGATGPDIAIDTIWTQDQADARLREDLQVALDAVHQHVTRPLTDNQEAALASFVFNLGETQFVKSTLLRKIKEGDDIGTALEFVKWHYDNGKKVKGLLRRRLDEAALFLK